MRTLKPLSLTTLTSVLVCFSACTQAQDTVTPCHVNSLATSSYVGLTAVHRIGDIRVYYTKTGEHAPVDLRDINGNDVPDYVENVGIQAHVMRQALTAMGFRDPLESARYRAAKFIDINIVGLPGYNGLAYDEPWIYAHPSMAHKEQQCGLQIDISNTLPSFPGSLSVVAHEMFHLFQYGYSMFHRSWFIEGTTYWAERLIRTGATVREGTTPLPSSWNAMQQEVFSQSGPHEFWSRLAVLTDTSSGKIQLPSHLINRTYVDGTTKVIKDDQWRGYAFLLAFLQTLDSEDDIVTATQGWTTHRWTDANQKASMHDPRVLQIIQRTLVRMGLSSPEIDAFLSVVPN